MYICSILLSTHLLIHTLNQAIMQTYVTFEHRPEFKKISPLGKVPVLVTPQGPLLESNAIARFIARHAPAKGLMGGSFFEQAQVDSWVDWTANEIEVGILQSAFILTSPQ